MEVRYRRSTLTRPLLGLWRVFLLLERTRQWTGQASAVVCKWQFCWQLIHQASYGTGQRSEGFARGRVEAMPRNYLLPSIRALPRSFSPSFPVRGLHNSQTVFSSLN